MQMYIFLQFNKIALIKYTLQLPLLSFNDTDGTYEKQCNACLHDIYFKNK